MNGGRVDNEVVRVWDLHDPQGGPRLLKPPGKPGAFGPYEIVWHLAFSPDGRRLASLTNDGRIRLWDLASGEVIAESPRAPTGLNRGVLAFTATGGRLVSGAADGGLRVWDVASRAAWRYLAVHRSTGLPFPVSGLRLPAH